jgi:hypothetical protein
MIILDRISPSSRLLMKKHGLDESHLDSRKVINKAYILSLLNNDNELSIEQPKFIKRVEHSDTKHILHKEIKHNLVHKVISNPVEQVKVENEEAQLNKSINFNLNENKNYLPLSYFENAVCVDNLLTYVSEMNSKHKLKINLEEFVVKVNIVKIGCQ